MSDQNEEEEEVKESFVNKSSIHECKICYEDFNTQDKEPLVLRCGHTFCMKCLNQLSSKTPLGKVSLKCPLDNKSQIFVSFALIPKNFAILE